MPEGSVPYVILVDETSGGAVDFANSVTGWARTSDAGSGPEGDDEPIEQPLEVVAERLIRVVMPEQLPALLQRLLLTSDQEDAEPHVVVALVGSDSFYWQVLQAYLEVAGGFAADRVVPHAFFPIPASPDTSETCWVKQLQQLDPAYAVNFGSDGWNQMVSTVVTGEDVRLGQNCPRYNKPCALLLSNQPHALLS